MSTACKRCSLRTTDLSPRGWCFECVGRNVAENPISLAAFERFAARGILTPAALQHAQAMFATRVALGFLERCRKR